MSPPSPSPNPPPGLLDESDADAAQYIETSSGGDHGWLTFTSKKLYTNAFIVLPGPPRKVVVKQSQPRPLTGLDL
jgi:hypothetical protein